MDRAVTATSPPRDAMISVPVVSLRELAPWVLFAAVLLGLVYFVGVEEGALSISSGMKVHEFLHDARHLLGFPCH